MPIVDADLKLYLSGGSANSDVDASIGDPISSVEFTTNVLHNLFDVVSSAETAAGDTEYRCVYIKNTHGSLTWTGPVLWISSQTPNSESSFEVAIGAAAVDATETKIADEGTAPGGGVTFTTPANEGAGLSVGDLAAGSYKAIWFKRIVDFGSGAYNNDQAEVTFKGDTAQ